MLYTLSEVRKSYGRKTILDIGELSIPEGEVVALQGPNGAGKTTLLNLLALLEAPSTGTLRYRGQQVVFQESALQRLRREIVMVDQHPILFTTTVHKNLEFGLKIRRIPPDERRARIARALELVGMQDFYGAMAHRLSGGETQRVALARALAVAPRVLLCDEPSASVDLENQAVINNILLQINQQEKMTVIFTSHDRFQAASIAHRTLFLDGGRVVDTLDENIFSALLLPLVDGGTLCRLRRGIEIPIQAGGRSGRARIRIAPHQVQVSAAGETHHPAHGCFPGRIVQVTEEKDRIRLVADIGVWLTLFMPAAEYRTKGLLVGDTVDVRIPPQAVSFLR